MQSDIQFYFQQYLDIHPYIIPLGAIGLWRWSVWLFKELVALRYRPKKTPYVSDVSIVTPVYNENKKIFQKALESWLVNKPAEIIAVIDYSDKRCIQVFKKIAKKHKTAHLIITKTPGKRPALADGIKAAKSEIVALVDSDTLWEKNVIKNGLPPFTDKKVAGVGTYQSVYKPKTIAQKIFDIQLDLRYCDEMPFLAAAGDALVCLSGRTAFYRKSVILPMLPDLVHETFLGQRVVSGDDKRLTYLVLAAGWKVAYQNNSRVYTPGMPDMPSFLKQRLRWTRNSLRSDLRAIFEGWPFHHPALVFFQVDKVAQSLVVVLSPIYFTISLLLGLWPLAAIIAVWWFTSRAIKMFPHLKVRPQDILLLPVFILYSFLTGILKIYAFFTLNTQGWITRWDKKRLNRIGFLKSVPSYAATAALLLLLVFAVFLYKQHTYIIPRQQEAALIAKTLPQQTVRATSKAIDAGPKLKNLLVSRYVVESGDSFGLVAQKFGISSESLLAANISRLTNWNRIEPGFVMNIPGLDQTFTPTFRFNYQRIYDDVQQIAYDASADTITVSGRGKIVTLSDIKNAVGEKYIKEVSPKVWFLTSTLYLRSGVTLNLNKDEVTWLRLKSTKEKFAILRGYNATIFINNVKITSWDDTKNDYDKEIKDGRSYIMVKDGSRMDIYNSELAYLGYARPPGLNASPYGVSWKMSHDKGSYALLTGEVLNSKFHDNYFGVYTFGATGMHWKGNEFYSNIRYGFDPHDDSNGFLIENNIAHDNGTHGFIISKRCDNNIFRNNIAYNNKLHGIMLHEQSNNNLLENNTLYNNTDGIALWHSSNNLIKNNTIYADKRGIRANAASNNNSIEKNIVTNIRQYGIYFYQKANDNIVSKNKLQNDNTALYIKTSGNTIINNQVVNNRIGILFEGYANGNKVIGNTIEHNSYRGIYSKIANNLANPISQNVMWRNRKDVVAVLEKPANTQTISIPLPLLSLSL